ncbi:PAS domain-containing protein [Klebsiella quasipneumoniae]|uniref:PAS domain-containing protein n=1 Tax=Klebsiella quasipneumoniae TaxID=1463165 RepID=UPI001BADC0AE|nr:hypothetical protein [Klebsiella quasipneumoniae]
MPVPGMDGWNQNSINAYPTHSSTQQEFEFLDDVTLMFTTDTSSHITYANEVFLRVSGFTRDELLP